MSYIAKAWAWYGEHTEHVDELRKLEINKLVPYFEPSGSDLFHPELYKPGHWRWFFANHTKKEDKND